MTPKLSNVFLIRESGDPLGSGWMDWDEFDTKHRDLSNNIAVGPDHKGETNDFSGLDMPTMKARKSGDTFELWDTHGPDVFPQHLVWDKKRGDLVDAAKSGRASKPEDIEDL